MKASELTDKHFSALITPEIMAICEPLKKLDTTYFLYSRIFKNRSAYTLTNQWETFYQHCKQQYFITPPIETNLITQKFYYLPCLNAKADEYKNFAVYRDAFNIGAPIYFVEIYKEHVDFYAFASSANNHNILNYYLNNIDILENFKFYFKDKAKKILIKAEKHKLIFPEQMLSAFTTLKKPEKPVFDKNKIWREITPNHYILTVKSHNISLTKREFDVLKNLAYGKSMKETAVATAISTRTAESYLNNIKDKTGFYKRSELIRHLQELNLF